MMDAGADSTFVSRQVRHPTLWLPDGNIVLSAPSSCRPCDILFRVHKSVLARASTVFNDMFALPTDPTAQDIYDSVPFVSIHDTAEELQSVLQLMYGDLWYAHF